MRLIRTPIFLVLVLCVVTAWGQSSTNQPRIGDLYPAGGQTGCVTQVTAGGQFLRGVTDVYISGQGVRASVIKYIRPLRNLQREQRQLLQKSLGAERASLVTRRWNAMCQRTCPVVSRSPQHCAGIRSV